MSITILIVGATGKQGGSALNALLDSPQASSLNLRFLTRNPDSPSAQKLQQRGAQAVKGDLTDASSLVNALQGVDRAFLMTDAMAGEKEEVVQGETFIDAAKKVGLKHLVYTSACGADTAVTVPHARMKYEVEKHLYPSGIPYTILRPVAFMDNFPTAPGMARSIGIGMFYSFTKGQPCKFIAVEDIGIFAAKALLSPNDPTFYNKIIDLAAGNYGLEDVKQAIRNAQGEEPKVAGYIPSFTRNLLPHSFKMMFINMEKKGYPPVDIEALKRIHPGLKSMEDHFRKG